MPDEIPVYGYAYVQPAIGSLTFAGSFKNLESLRNMTFNIGDIVLIDGQTYMCSGLDMDGDYTATYTLRVYPGHENDTFVLPNTYSFEKLG